MNLIRYLMRQAPGAMALMGATALLSGACNVGLIALVNAVLTRPSGPAGRWVWGFVALGLGKLGSNFASQYVLVKFSQQNISQLRRDLIRKVLAVPLRRLEELGAARVTAVLTSDVLAITQALLGIPSLTVNLSILVGGAAYLGWLSWRVLFALAALIGVAALGYRVLVSSGFGYLSRAREDEDVLFGHFRALTEGIKELKLHRRRRQVFFDRDIEETTERYQRNNVSAELRFMSARAWNYLLYFALIGLVLFALPTLQQLTPQAMTKYVVTILYLMGPLAGVLDILSVYGRADVSLRKIEQLGLSLSADNRERFSLARPAEEPRLESLELLAVTHAYQHEKDDTPFVLGPVDLEFQPGELVFLIGGNGSGKSTLAKIITGLYPPQSGEIRVNGKRVTDQNRDDYRQFFSAVFADFYLFTDLLGVDAATLDVEAGDYLERLHLNHKVKVRNGALSTTALSSGQRKRLALLTAYLEDRPFYLFDEWACDQDPQFKEVFYNHLLPELRNRGKIVLVITHDEHYFPSADRGLKLDYGRLVEQARSEPFAARAAVLSAR